MKRNGAVKTYLPIPQTQSDDEDNTQLSNAEIEKSQNNSPSGTTTVAEEKIVKSTDEVVQDDSLSPVRLFLFVSSLIFCILAILAFLFLIPCREESFLDIKYHLNEVITSIQGISVVTNLQILNDSALGPCVLFGFHSSNNQSFEYGLTAVHLVQKKEIWHTPISVKPVHFHCEQHKPKGGSQKILCIINGVDGSIVAIEARNGSVQWLEDSISNQTNKIQDSFSLFVPNCKKGIHPDILQLSTEKIVLEDQETVHSIISFLSGSSGELIKGPQKLPICAAQLLPPILQNTPNGSAHIIVYCQDELGVGTLWKISLATLCNLDSNVESELRESSFERIFSFPNKEKAVDVIGIQQPNGSTDILVAFEGALLLYIDGDNYKQEWMTTLSKVTSIRFVLIGQFIPGKRSGIIIAGDTEILQSVIVLLDPFNGTEVWSYPFTNGTLTSLDIIQQPHSSMDQLLVKSSLTRPVTLVHTPITTKESNYKARPRRGLSLNEIISATDKKRKHRKILHDSDVFDPFDQEDDLLTETKPFPHNIFNNDEKREFPSEKFFGDEILLPGKKSPEPQVMEYIDNYYKLTWDQQLSLKELFSISSRQNCTDGLCFPQFVRSEYAVVEERSTSGYMILVSSSTLLNGTTEKPFEETVLQRIRLDEPIIHKPQCLW